eukprot:m.139892 g.139892  ORF g.139892 m.139892 type:complete len:500 (+) comp30089_c1_seq3:268-1767(+)
MMARLEESDAGGEKMVAAGGHPGSEMETHNKGQFYKRPRQQKQWGEEDPTHHFNPFDTFFDLVFVGGAYAAGNMLKSDLSANGIMIFLSSALLLRWVWSTKVIRDTRFVFNSSFHTGLDVVHLVMTMVMVLNYETTAKLTDASSNAALGVSTGLLGTRIIDALRDLEITLMCEGTEAKRVFWMQLPNHILVLASAAVAIVYSLRSSSLDYIWIPWLLAGEPQFVIYQIIFVVNGRRTFPPMNITFWIHRNAEWAMLMLGEAIFSLLYISSDSVNHERRFYTVFIFGTLTVTMICLHYFANYESQVKHHVLKRNRFKSILFFASRDWLSVSLLALGASFKIMLYHLDDVYIKQKYANVFAYSFAFSLLASDLSKLLHNNGTEGVCAYFIFIFGWFKQCKIARALSAIWIFKFAVVAVSLALPHFKLDALAMAETACALSFIALVLVNLQNHTSLDINLVAKGTCRVEQSHNSQGHKSRAQVELKSPPIEDTRSLTRVTKI